jgi:hypothetical protein
MTVRGRKFLVALGLGVVLAGPALAASPQDRTECAADDPARAIPACSRIIPDQDESAAEPPSAAALALIVDQPSAVAQPPPVSPRPEPAPPPSARASEPKTTKLIVCGQNEPGRFRTEVV